MKKSLNNNKSHIIKKKEQNIRNINFTKNNKQFQQSKDKHKINEKVLDKNLIPKSFKKNINNINSNHRKIRTTKVSPKAINHKIFKDGIPTNKEQTQNYDTTSTILFNINSKNNIIQKPKNPSEAKNKSNSIEKNGNKDIKKVNKYQLKTQFNKKTLQKSYNNLVLKKSQNNSNNNNNNTLNQQSQIYNFSYSSNNKPTRPSRTSTANISKNNNIIRLHCLMNKNNLKTTPTNEKNSIKLFHEHNKPIELNKTKNRIKLKISPEIGSNINIYGTNKNSNIKSIMNQNIKYKKIQKKKRIINITKTKNTITTEKNKHTNLLSNSFSDSKKFQKKNTNMNKTKIEVKNKNILKKKIKYFIKPSNPKPKIIYNYKTNNTYISNKNSINKKIQIKTINYISKHSVTGNNTKITNKLNSKYQTSKIIKSKIKKGVNLNSTNNNNKQNSKLKDLRSFYSKKINNPKHYTSYYIKSESKNVKNKKFSNYKTNNNELYLKSKESKSKIKNIFTNDENNKNTLDLDIFCHKNKNDPENNISTISQRDFNYYNEESSNLISIIQKFGKGHNFKKYPKTDLNFYKIGRCIGHGAFGKVNISLHVLSGHIVAIKSFNKIKKNFPINRIYYEIKILKKLRNHKNIIKYFEHFENEKYFFIVMENIAGGNLLSAINKMSKLSEIMAKNIFKQLIETLKYLHNLGIVHRDIKPDNILIDLDNTIKLIDFGVSKEVKYGQLLNDSCGTPAFIAPEILKDSPYDPYMTDIWSSGVLLYVMVSGFFPFRGSNESELHSSILSGSYPKIKGISNELNDLIKKMLELNPKKRIKIDNILSHPWLNTNINPNDTNINLFTNAEKIIYGKLKLDYRKNNKEEILENFTYRNMKTEYIEENQNLISISYIKTPYNSSRSRDDQEDLYYDDVNIEDNIIKFLSKAGEMNRQYEVCNNCDFDQGFKVKLKGDYRQKSHGSKHNSFNDEKIKVERKNVEKKNNNEINQNESIVELKEENKNIEKIDLFKINNKIINKVENLGFNKEFVIKSLLSNDNNHSIASYYLFLSLSQ